MPKEIEIEKTYLAKHLPSDLENCESKIIEDIYIPKDAEHARLRIRKNGDKYVITKKEPVENATASINFEHNINITEKEFKALQNVVGDVIRKRRYYYNYNDRISEIDVFEGKLKGLVVVDFEFETQEEQEAFEMPDFCLADVTEEHFIAGGILCRSSFEDLEEDLKRFNYKAF